MTVASLPPCSAAWRSRPSSWSASSRTAASPSCPVTGQQDLGEGHVLVLPQVGELLRGGHAVSLRPAVRGVEVIEPEVEPCGQRVQGSDVG